MPTCVKRKTTLKQMENVIFRTPSVKLQCKGTSNVVIRFSARLYKYKGNLPPLRTARDVQVKYKIWKSAIHEFSGTLVPLKLFSKTIFFHPSCFCSGFKLVTAFPVFWMKMFYVSCATQSSSGPKPFNAATRNIFFWPIFMANQNQNWEKAK